MGGRGALIGPVGGVGSVLSGMSPSVPASEARPQVDKLWPVLSSQGPFELATQFCGI